jgi:hypothetical protein
MKEIKEMIIVTICLLLITSVEVKALGLTYPLPNELELLQGESGRFRFEIQNMVGNDSQTCTYDVQGFKKIETGWCNVLSFLPCSVSYESGVGYYPFNITWDSEPPVALPVTTVKTIYGTAIAPLDAQFGQYNLTIEVTCTPVGTQGVTIANVRRVPFIVSIVKEHTKPIFENPEPPYDWTPAIAVILIAAIISVISLAYYYLIYKKPKND